MKRLLLLSIALITIVTQAQASDPLDADTLLRMIQERGARATIDAMWGKPSWEEMIQHVATGSVKWLTVAEQLHPGSDAGSSSELKVAVAWALPKAPEQVLLKITESSSSAKPSNLFTLDVCNGPPVDFPNNDYGTYYKESLAAVRKVKNAKLNQLRSACLRNLKAGADYMKNKEQ